MKRPWFGLATVVVLGAALDQASKAWAEAHVRGRGVTVLLDQVIELRFSRNRGAFFSLGASMDESVRVGVLVGATLVAMAFILHVFRGSMPQQGALRWGLSLLMAGAVGNLIDRVRNGEVTDFLHLHAGDIFHWATFNLADVYIFVGLLLLAVDLLGTQQPPGAADSP